MTSPTQALPPSADNPAGRNADPKEIDKFSELAHRWWDPESEFRPLHQINPLRLDWIDGLAALRGKRVVDVGCGGGILAESMARRGGDAYNQRLSVRRAEAVKSYLVGKGVERNRVYTEGKGEKQPVADNKTAEGRAKNRRVEIEVVGTRGK